MSVVGRVCAAVTALFMPLGTGACVADADGIEIDGIRWHLQTDERAYFEIKGTALSGKDACNQVMGEVTLSESEPVTLRFGSLGATKMLCPDTRETEREFAAALKGERIAEQPEEGVLVLRDASTGKQWRFVAGSSTS